MSVFEGLVGSTELPIPIEDYRIAWQLSKDVYNSHKIENLDTQIQVDYELIKDKEGKTGLWIAFSGSWEFLDWLRNLVFYRQDNPFDNDDTGDTTVHTGWMFGYKSIREHLLQDVYMMDFDYTVFVGHSAGGATACIAAMDLVTILGAHRALPKLYTFGAASPGNINFARMCDVHIPSHYKFVTQFDPVPFMPPGCPLLGLGFHQPGKAILIPGLKSHGLEHYKL